jgi:hypothetical protein
VFEEEGGSNDASLLVLILFIYFNYLPFQNIYITRERERERAGGEPALERKRRKKKKEKRLRRREAPMVLPSYPYRIMEVFCFFPLV